MLKITGNTDSGALTIKLEGKLAGDWVQELRECWRQASSNCLGASIRIDLAGVTWVSEEGRSLLVLMYRSGAELLSANLLTASIIAEISAETTR